MTVLAANGAGLEFAFENGLEDLAVKRPIPPNAMLNPARAAVDVVVISGPRGRIQVDIIYNARRKGLSEGGPMTAHEGQSFSQCEAFRNELALVARIGKWKSHGLGTDSAVVETTYFDLRAEGAQSLGEPLEVGDLLEIDHKGGFELFRRAIKPFETGAGAFG